jgi:hypothetical protein
MKNQHFASLAIVLSLAGCQSTPSAKPPSSQQPQEWKQSTLSPDTIAKVKAVEADYNQCLTAETKARAYGDSDPRAIANAILNTCEPRLVGIKTAFDAEQVPASISEHKIRQTRSHGAQRIMLDVQSVHALRAAEQAEAKQALEKSTKKAK